MRKFHIWNEVPVWPLMLLLAGVIFGHTAVGIYQRHHAVSPQPFIESDYLAAPMQVRRGGVVVVP